MGQTNPSRRTNHNTPAHSVWHPGLDLCPSTQGNGNTAGVGSAGKDNIHGFSLVTSQTPIATRWVQSKSPRCWLHCWARFVHAHLAKINLHLPPTPKHFVCCPIIFTAFFSSTQAKKAAYPLTERHSNRPQLWGAEWIISVVTCFLCSFYCSYC